MGKKITRAFKKNQCDHCKLADKRELHEGGPDYCGYKKKQGKNPDIKNGLCLLRVPMKKGDGG